MKVRYTDENGTSKWINQNFVYYKYIQGKWVLQKHPLRQKNKTQWIEKKD